jgi:hypothetical protein
MAAEIEVHNMNAIISPLFQTEHRSPITGGVDEATAEAINRELAKHDIRPARHQEESAGERLASFVETVN